MKSSVFSLRSSVLLGFLLVFSLQSSVFSPAARAALSITAGPASNITRVAADFYGNVVSTNAGTNAVILYYGGFDCTNDPAAWGATNAYGVVASLGTIATNITGLTPAQQYYYRWRIIQSTNSSWSSTSNFWTLTGAPTSTPTVVTNVPLMVSTGGAVVAPAGFLAANGIAMATGLAAEVVNRTNADTNLQAQVDTTTNRVLLLEAAKTNLQAQIDSTTNRVLVLEVAKTNLQAQIDTSTNTLTILSNAIPWGLTTATNTFTNLLGTSSGSTATGTYTKVADYTGYPSYYLADGGMYGSFWVWYDTAGSDYIISTNQGVKQVPYFVLADTTNFLGSYGNQQAGFPVVISDASTSTVYASLSVYSTSAGTASNLGGVPASQYTTNSSTLRSVTNMWIDAGGVTQQQVFTAGRLLSWKTNSVEVQ